MSAGLPVVASALGSNLENIEDGKSGFLAETEEDWYDKIKILLEDSEMRSKFGVEGRKMVMEKFDIQKQYDFLEKEFNLLRERAEFSNKTR